MVGSSDTSANDLDPDGPGVLPNGSFDNCLTGILISGSYAAATEFCFPQVITALRMTGWRTEDLGIIGLPS